MGFEEWTSRQTRRLELGGPCPALILALDSEVHLSDLEIGGRKFTAQTLFVPPAARPVISQHSGYIRCMEVELAPWAASAITGVAPCDWPRRAISLAELGRSADTLTSGLICGGPTFEGLFRQADRMLGRRIETTNRRVPAEIRWAWSELAAHCGSVRISDLARKVGWSRRHFTSRFTEWTGLTPKFLCRSFRFQRARQHLACGSASLAEVAHVCGYSDQSHLTRECVALAGCTPSELKANLLSGFPGVSAAAVERG